MLHLNLQTLQPGSLSTQLSSYNAFEEISSLQQNNRFSLFRSIIGYGFRIDFMDDCIINKALISLLSHLFSWKDYTEKIMLLIGE